MVEIAVVVDFAEIMMDRKDLAEKSSNGRSRSRAGLGTLVDSSNTRLPKAHQ